MFLTFRHSGEEKHPEQRTGFPPPPAAFQTSPKCAAALASIFILLSSHVEARAHDYYDNFHINGMINEEYYLISNWGFGHLDVCYTGS